MHFKCISDQIPMLQKCNLGQKMPTTKYVLMCWCVVYMYQANFQISKMEDDPSISDNQRYLFCLLFSKYLILDNQGQCQM